MAASATQTAPALSGHTHKHTDSIDSEISYFETTSSCTTDSWNSYFDGWDKSHSQDLYCPQIVNSSPSQYQTYSYNQPQQAAAELEQQLPPVMRPKRPRPDSLHQPTTDMFCEPPKVKRFGLISHGDRGTESQTISHLNQALQNSSASTEDLLKAMYNPDWDVASLQRWYHSTSRSPADLALYKIMFSLRYTPDEAGRCL